MAKRICRTADRFDPTGMPRPRYCVRRATPPSCTAVVHELSQRGTDAFIFGEGCAGLARRQTGRDHSLPPGPGRAAPPICSDLIYDRHRCLENTFKGQSQSRRLHLDAFARERYFETTIVRFLEIKTELILLDCLSANFLRSH